MIGCFYLPMVAALTAPTYTVFPVELALDGAWSAALEVLSSDDERPRTLAVTRTAARLQAIADVSFARRVDAETENAYRVAQSARRTERRHYRLYCLRNSGWQYLLRGKFGEALTFFVRLERESQENFDLRWEAHFGLALALYDAGDGEAAQAVAAQLTQPHLAYDTIPSERRALVDLLAFELSIRDALLGMPSLQGHIFRQARARSNPTLSTATLARIVVPDVGHSFALKVRRDFLLALRAEALGRSTMKRLTDFNAIHWAQGNWFRALASSMKVDVLLAALAGGNVDLASSAAKSMQSQDREEELGRRIDYLFALTELSARTSESERWRELYQRYASETVSAIRANTFGLAFYRTRATTMGIGVNDIGGGNASGLPARYRRAHSFIQQNLARKNLSVQEVAAATGVTARTLQNIFMRALGQTPSAFIRQLRMQQIETELSDEAMLGHIPEAKLAKEWGMYTESSQLIEYRQARSGIARPAPTQAMNNG